MLTLEASFSCNCLARVGVLRTPKGIALAPVAGVLAGFVGGGMGKAHLHVMFKHFKLLCSSSGYPNLAR